MNNLPRFARGQSRQDPCPRLIQDMTKKNTTERLESLLAAALEKTVVSFIHDKHIDLENFKTLLSYCRTKYAPDTIRAVSVAQPEIRDSQIRDSVLDFIYSELANFVQDGKIHSATVAFAGGIASGTPVERVLRNLLIRAIVDGPSNAALAFADCITHHSCKFYEFLLIAGISVSEVTELVDGITLIPLPESVDDFPAHVPDLRGAIDQFNRVDLNDLKGKALVQTEYEVSPIFHKPMGNYTFDSGPSRHFTINPMCGSVPEHTQDILWQALSLASRSDVKPVMGWRSLLDYEIFDLSPIPAPRAKGYWHLNPGTWPHNTNRLNKRQIDDSKTYYAGLTQEPSELWEKLNVPISRWISSISKNDPVDQIIDLGIALESLYASDVRSGPGITFALHAAWHLGKNKTERKSLRDEFKHIYSARSDAVHTGKLRGKWSTPQFNIENLISRTQSLCWQGITSIIDAGELPDWDDLAMGQDSD